MNVGKIGGVMMSRRINPILVKFLYLAGYSQGDIAFIYGSVSGHISKVLKAAGVPARARGMKAIPTSIKAFPKEVVDVITSEGLMPNFVEWERVKGDNKPLTKGATPVAKAKPTGATATKPKAPKQKVENAKKPLSDQMLDKACLSLLQTIVKNTPLKKVKFKKKPSFESDPLFNSGKRMCTLESDWYNTKDTFLWIDHTNFFDYVDYTEEDDPAIAMDRHYDAYSIIDPAYCKNMAATQSFIQKVLVRAEKSYPNLEFTARAYGQKGDFLVVVSCRNK